ncbi:hypothetical protein CMUST_01295 [Corynebacterium mustelae]|uniref:Uncharacterized protein n=1 Tax=Corynebacterium mustelae TaxID=571915 RepID=A0A0G3GYK8_9CORY|nr:hypothetical protein [Corynebacterium mustelae]AKK04608.1 hypothetical protein CMUST_01295 [Corynebacterium mustelae]
MPIDKLPSRIQPAAYRVRSAAMTDGTALLIVGLMGVARGVSSLATPLYIHPAEMWLDNEIWVVTWLTIGIMNVVSAACPASRFARISFGLIVGLNVLWGLSFAAASVLDHVNLWASAINHWGISALVMWSIWRGSRRHVRLEVSHE